MLPLLLTLLLCVSGVVSYPLSSTANFTSLADVQHMLYPGMDVINAENVDEFFTLYNKYTTPRHLLGDSNGGVYGVDVSQAVGQSAWACLKKASYNVGVVRQYQSICRVDPNGVHSVANAWAAGLAHVDIYLFPSYTCGNGPAVQVQQAIEGMGTIPFGTLWFDIEAAGSSWSSDPNNNHIWVSQGIEQAVRMIGASRVGIYTSKSAWQKVMGSYSDFARYPVWYAHYDNNPSFSDWSSFGGWSRPAMKQYVGDASVCGVGVDLNWYP